MQSTILPNFSIRPYVAPQPQKAPESHGHGGNHLSKTAKAGIFCSTLLGVTAAVALLAKGKGMKFFEALKKMQYEELEISALAIGSVGGGLIGGAIFDDKKNLKAKVRESVIQLVGNIWMPIICVSACVRPYKALKAKGLINMPQLKGISKPIKYLNAAISGIPAVVSSVAGLGAGIVLGNKVANGLNEKVFKVKDNRKVELKDFSAHIDDMCLATTLVTMGNPNIFSKCVSRIIPAALMVAGYSVGSTEEKHAK